MKGLRIRLVRAGVEVKTEFVSKTHVAWVDGEDVDYTTLLNRGWKPNQRDKVNQALRKIEEMWDKFCSGRNIVNEDLYEVVQLLREAGCEN